MALPSNVMRSSSGAMLPFFSPHPTPGCSGVNLFSQSPDIHPPRLFSYPYVFPLICLIPNVLRFISSFAISFTVVVPDVLSRRFRWALLPHCPSSSLLLAREGQVGVLHPPSNNNNFIIQEWLSTFLAFALGFMGFSYRTYLSRP